MVFKSNSQASVDVESRSGSCVTVENSNLDKTSLCMLMFKKKQQAKDVAEIKNYLDKYFSDRYKNYYFIHILVGFLLALS